MHTGLYFANGTAYGALAYDGTNAAYISDLPGGTYTISGNTITMTDPADPKNTTKATFAINNNVLTITYEDGSKDSRTKFNSVTGLTDKQFSNWERDAQDAIAKGTKIPLPSEYK